MPPAAWHLETDVVFLQRKPRSVAVSAINAIAACITGAAKVAQ